MLFEQSLRVSASPEQVWAAVTDLASLAECLPGARLESMDAQGRSHGAMTVRVGSIVTRFEGTAWIESRDDESMTTEVVAEGAGPQGKAQARIGARVQPEGDASRLDLSVSIDISGPLARLGQGMAKPVVAQLVQQFGATLSGRVAAGGPTRATATPPAASPAPTAGVAAAPTAAPPTAAASRAADAVGADTLDLSSLLGVPPALRKGLVMALVAGLFLVVARALRRPAAPSTVVIYACADPSSAAGIAAQR